MERKNHEISFKCKPTGRFEITDNKTFAASAATLESAVRMLKTARKRAEEYRSRFRSERTFNSFEPMVTEVLERALVDVY